MPAIADAPSERLTLADFNGPGAPPDDYVMPPSKSVTPPPAAPPTDATKPLQQEPSIKPLVEEPEPEKPSPTEKPEPEPEPEPEKFLGDMMEDPGEVAAREAAAKAEADKKAADEAAASERAKAAGEQPPPSERDADLKIEQAPHVHPSTRKKFEAVAAKTKAARDERDAAIAKAAELEKRALAAEEKVKTATEAEARLKAIEERAQKAEERVRELDITKDPILQDKYDKRINANREAIIKTLKDQGFGKVKTKKEGSDDYEYVDDPAKIKELMETGLTLKTLQPYITAMEEAELLEEADSVRELVRENNRIAREKQQEIEAWKGDYTKKQQQQTELAKQREAQQRETFAQHRDAQFKAGMAELEKSFPHIKAPPAPLPTDTPATQKAKQAALDEWTAAAKAIEEAEKSFTTGADNPAKSTEVAGRIYATALQAEVMRHHILPRVMKELSTLKARNTELESELGKIRDAGRLSRAQSLPSDAPRSGGPEAKTLEEAFVAPPGMT